MIDYLRFQSRIFITEKDKYFKDPWYYICYSLFLFRKNGEKNHVHNGRGVPSNEGKKNKKEPEKDTRTKAYSMQKQIEGFMMVETETL